MDNLYELSNIENFIDKRFWIFGAGVKGIEFYRKIINSGYNISGFVDNDTQKYKTNIKGTDKICISFDELITRCKTDEKNIIIITTHQNEIFKQLTDAGIEQNQIFSSWAILHMIKYDIKNRFFKEYFRKEWLIDEYKHAACVRAYFYAYHSSLNYVRTWRRLVEENPILVYQFGKVGSTSIYESINLSGIKAEQTHSVAFVPSFMSQEMKDLYFIFKETCKKQEIKIINIVREPIRRDISMLFEIIDVPGLYMFSGMTTNWIDSIIDVLLNKIYNDEEEILRLSPLEYHYGYVLRGLNGNIFNWYNLELEKVFNMDIFQNNFNQKQGIGYIKNNNINCLFLTFEKLKQNENIIADFLNLNEFKLSKKNLAIDKPYSFVYKNILNNITLPTEYINRYYKNNKYLKYFYSDTQISEFKNNIM